MTSPFDLAFHCSVPWETMDERGPGMRRCGACERDVVDVSALSRKAATRLLKAQPDTCISYLIGPSGAPIFKRPPAGTGLAALASVMLAACSADEPATYTPAPEPTAVAPSLLLDANPRFARPLTAELHGAPVPLVTVTPIASQQLDTAGAGDPNDVDGARPRHRNHAPPPPVPIRTRTAGVPMRR